MKRSKCQEIRLKFPDPFSPREGWGLGTRLSTLRLPSRDAYSQALFSAESTPISIIPRSVTLSVTQSAFASTSDRPLCFPRACAVSSDHAPLITRTRYLPVIISYRPSFSLRSASGAPCQPDNSVLTHLRVHAGIMRQYIL